VDKTRAKYKKKCLNLDCIHYCKELNILEVFVAPKKEKTRNFVVVDDDERGNNSPPLRSVLWRKNFRVLKNIYDFDESLSLKYYFFVFCFLEKFFWKV